INLKTMKKQILKIIIFLMITIPGFAQQDSVNGTVTDAITNEPLPGVNVLIKGTKIGSITDIDGNYSLVVSPEDVLVFSFISYVTQEIPVGNQSRIDVSLQEDLQSLNEVVVVGYQVQRRTDLTGSIAVVD